MGLQRARSSSCCTCDARGDDDFPDALGRPCKHAGLVCHGQHGVQGDEEGGVATAAGAAVQHVVKGRDVSPARQEHEDGTRGAGVAYALDDRLYQLHVSVAGSSA